MVEDTKGAQPGRTTMLARSGHELRASRSVIGVMLLVFVPVASSVGLEILATVLSRPMLAAFCGVCAILFAVPHFLILWLDRNEREPLYLVLTALFWGGVMATGASGMLNTINGVLSSP